MDDEKMRNSKLEKACCRFLSFILIGFGVLFLVQEGTVYADVAKPDFVFVQVPAVEKGSAASSKWQSFLGHRIDGCRVVRFSPSTGDKEVVPLTPEFLSACDPAVSFDGKKILFAGKRTSCDSWQVWQMNADGSNKVQVTRGKIDCWSPFYIGSLFHLDDKKPTPQLAYVSGGHLYTCELDGKNPRRITYNLYPEFSPDVLPNGRIVFSSFKKNGFKSAAPKVVDLLAVNIDGTDLMGYLTHLDVPGNKEMVRIAPDGRIYFIQTAILKTSQKDTLSTLSSWPGGGALAFALSKRPAHSYRVLDTAEKGFYHSPCPLPDGGLLVSFRSKLPNSLYSLYLIKGKTTGVQTESKPQASQVPNCRAIGGPGGAAPWRPPRRRPRRAAGGIPKQPLYISTTYHCISARVLAPHPVVRGRSSFVAHQQDSGVLYCLDVTISDRAEMQNVGHEMIKEIRVVEGFWPEKGAMGNSSKRTIRRVIGTAPMEPDGSFHIRVPARTPIAFQLLDEDGMAICSQLSWTWVLPRESRGCIGCHEERDLAPPNRLTRSIIKPAVKLLTPPEQRYTVDFVNEVEPVAKKSCHSCHSDYKTVIYKNTVPGSARKSPLMSGLTGKKGAWKKMKQMPPHQRLDKTVLRLLAEWIDLGAQYDCRQQAGKGPGKKGKPGK